MAAQSAELAVVIRKTHNAEKRNACERQSQAEFTTRLPEVQLNRDLNGDVIERGAFGFSKSRQG
jgi:hypothetical protein